MSSKFILPRLCRAAQHEYGGVATQLLRTPVWIAIRPAHSNAAMKTPGGVGAGVGSGSRGRDRWYIRNKNKSQLPRAIIFDKNGTLIDFHSLWTPWVTALTSRLEQATGLDLQQRVFKELDFCHFTNKTRSGLLGHGTSWEIKHELENVLFELGLPRRHAQVVIERCWQECTVGSSQLEPVGDVREMMKLFRWHGVQVALCTSDSRANTEKTLRELRLHGLMDEVLCGDDIDCRPKPSSRNVKMLCERMGIRPQEAVVVGDTSADMEMGFSAGAGLNIGVLSGIGNRLNLAPKADRVIDSVDDLVPLILGTNLWEAKKKQASSHASVNHAAKQKDEDKKKASLVIFDKDGTLICFHSMWTPWAEAFMERLEKDTGLQLREKVLEALGYCHQNQKWTPGLFAEGTTIQNQELVVKMLIDEGLEAKDAERVLARTWEDGDHSKGDHLKVVDNPASLFKSLKQHGIKVAICTADSRVATEQFVKTEGLSDYVDTLVCGDDQESIPKPSPHNAHVICKRLGVDPLEAVMIGDTVADMGMGRSAELGATVGVLSGVGEVGDLDPQADHIVPSIQHVLPIVVDMEDKTA